MERTRTTQTNLNKPSDANNDQERTVGPMIKIHIQSGKKITLMYIFFHRSQIWILNNKNSYKLEVAHVPILRSFIGTTRLDLQKIVVRENLYFHFDR